MRALKEKIIKPIFVIAIILVLTLADFILAGLQIVSYAVEAIEETNESNVLFSAYFLDENGQQQQSLEKKLNEEAKLIMEVQVENAGYFDGTIELKNSNFKIRTYENNDAINNIDGNKIKLNQINAGNQIKLEFVIEANKDDVFETANLSKITDINITGTYVNDSKRNNNIDTTRQIQIKWNSPCNDNDNLELKPEIVTNKIYEINGVNKRIVQVCVESGLINNDFPIKSTKISTSILNNVEDVYVQSRGTYSTNNDNGIDANWDKTSNQFIIEIKNEENNGYVYWNKEKKDNVIVTFVLPEDSTIDGETLKINSQVDLYDENTQLTKNVDISDFQEKDGAIDYKIERNEEIYKGNLYYSEDTEINSKSIIDFRVKGISENITIQEGNSKYNTNNIANLYYTKTTINKTELSKILGENGRLSVKTLNGDVISSISTEDLNKNENEYIDLEYDGQNNIIFEFSGVTGEGKIELNNRCILNESEYNKLQIKQFNKLESVGKLTADKNIKEINKDVQFDLKEPETYATIESSTNVLSTLQTNENVDFNIILKTDDAKYDLYKNPTIEMVLPVEIENIDAKLNPVFIDGLSVDNASFDRNENGNIVIKVKLSGEQIAHSNMISEGLIINIKANINVNKFSPSKNTNINVYYTNENDGNAIHELQLPITIQSKDGVLVYSRFDGYNSNGDILETMNFEKMEGNLDLSSCEKQANSKIVLVNNYDEALKNIAIIGENSQEGNLDLNLVNSISANKDVNISYSENGTDWYKNIDEIENAKKYKIEIDTIDAMSTLEIDCNYLIPENLEKDVFVELLQNIKYEIYGQDIDKSIIVNLMTEKSEQTEEKEADEEQTANLLGAELNYFSNTFSVTGDFDIETKAYAGEKEITENENIYEYEHIKYVITVTNKTNEDVNNGKIEAKHQNANIYGLVEVETKNNMGTEDEPEPKIEHIYKEWDTGEITFDNINLKSGQSVKLSYEVVVKKVEGDNESTYGVISLIENDNELTKVNTIKNKILHAEMKIRTTFVNTEELKMYAGSTLPSALYLNNVCGKDLNNVTLKIKLSDGLTIDTDSSYFGCYHKTLVDMGQFEDSTETGVKEIYDVVDDGIIEKNIYNGYENTITVKINKFAKDEDFMIELYPIIKSLEIGTETKDVSISAELISESGTTYESNIIHKEVYQAKKDISIKQYTDKTENSFKDKDTFTITIEVNNNQDEKAVDVGIIDDIDEVFKVNSITVVRGDESSDGIENLVNNSFEILENLEPHETLKILINVTVDYNDSAYKKFVNSVFLSYEGGELNNSMDLHINSDLSDSDFIVDDDDDKNNDNDDNDDNDNDSDNDKDNDDNNNNNGDNAEETNNKISGVAWLDKNKNGIRETSEEKLQNLKVYIANADTGELLKDKDGNILYVMTNSNGEYQFNVDDGNYIILFMYDSENYGVTQYKLSGVNDKFDCDAISKYVDIDGNVVLVGITDKIKVEKESKENIDIGLIEKEIFDLKLDKYVSKIAVQNANGTKEYSFDKSQLAKVEVKAKNYVGTTVVVEYDIVITNEGEVEGFANDIVDYIPDGYKFSSELNKDWYKGSDGELHNISLENTKIASGESKTIKLILTKTLNANDGGRTVNTAEIYKSTNSQNIKDKDSVAGNKQDKEDDISSASVIISIGTGVFTTCIVGILITLIIIAILIYVYFLKRKEV